jgi:hypothetical protein
MEVVHLSFTAVTNDVYQFDTRLNNHLNADVVYPVAGATEIVDGFSDVGSPNVASISSFEIY